ncbi:MAG TPA: sugar phosphate isomerase/epimerase family protein [Candidatus Omnitrophota bacterium]|nr:sugar phosphate isomerase/epimerase family protein [Candidatus Omnitrophota bacterium]
MSRIAISNIGLPPLDHVGLLPAVAALGVRGVEVAPSRVWADTWHGLSAAEVEAYRRALADAGLSVVGIHSLFFDRPHLGLFKPEARAETLDFLVHLSALCRDLGGRTLIYGGGRHRRDLAPDAAMAECRSFLSELLPRVEAHGTTLCFEPLGPKDTDFLNTAAECLALVEEFDHPALGHQLDAKALADNGEADAATFAAAKDRICHYHANDPGLVVVGSTGAVDHAALGGLLRGIGYDGWVSVEQRMLSPTDPLADLAASVAAVKACYGEAR